MIRLPRAAKPEGMGWMGKPETHSCLTGFYLEVRKKASEVESRKSPWSKITCTGETASNKGLKLGNKLI